MIKLALKLFKNTLLQLLKLAANKALDHSPARLQGLKELRRFANLLLEGVF